MSRTLSGLFLVGALNRPRKRERTIRDNPRTIPEQIRKIPEKSGKSQKGQKRTKKEGQVQIRKPPRLKAPRLAALDYVCVPFPFLRSIFFFGKRGWVEGHCLLVISCPGALKRGRQMLSCLRCVAKEQEGPSVEEGGVCL